MGSTIGLGSADTIAKEIATVAAAYTGVTWDVLGATNEGLVVPHEGSVQPLVYLPADAPGSAPSGEMVLHYARTLFDDGVLMRHSTSLAELAPGAFAYFNNDDARRLGLVPNDEVDVKTNEGSARLTVRTDESLAHGVVYVPFNQPGIPSLGSDPVVTVSKA
jgi:predicted molibdopterin-dependent oxidoreductase YjgC